MRRRSYGDSVSARNREQILQQARRLKVRRYDPRVWIDLPITVYLRHERLKSIASIVTLLRQTTSLSVSRLCMADRALCCFSAQRR